MDMTTKQKEQTVSEFAVGDLVEVVEEIDGIKAGTRAKVVTARSGYLVVDLYGNGGREDRPYTNLWYFPFRFKKVHQYKAGDIVRYIGPVQDVVGTEMQVSEVEVLRSGKQFLRGTVTKAVDPDWFVEDRPISFRETAAEPVEEVVESPEPEPMPAPFNVGDRVEFVEDYSHYEKKAVIGAKGTVKEAYSAYPGVPYVTIELDNGGTAKGLYATRVKKLEEPEVPFKIGDAVEFVEPYGSWSEGERATVTGINPSNMTGEGHLWLVEVVPVSDVGHPKTVAFEGRFKLADEEVPFKVGDKVSVPVSNKHGWSGEGVVDDLLGEDLTYDLNVRFTRGGIVAFYFHEVEPLEDLAEWEKELLYPDEPAPKLWTEQAEVGTYGYTLDGSSRIARIIHKTAEDNWIIQYPHRSPSESYIIGVLVSDNDGMNDFISEEEFIRIS